MNALGKKYLAWLAWWVRLMQRHAGKVVISTVVVILLAGTYTINNLSIYSQLGGLLSQDLEFQKDEQRYKQTFPQYNGTMVVVLDAENPDRLDEAADLLKARMTEHPAVFGQIFDPAGDPFFRRNGLLFLSVDDLLDLSERLASAQPLLAELHTSPHLPTLLELISRAMDEMESGTAGAEFDLAAALNGIDGAAAAQADSRFGEMSWWELMLGRPANSHESRRLLILNPPRDAGKLAPLSDAIKLVRQFDRDLGLEQSYGVTLRITGTAVLGQDELNNVLRDINLAGLVSLSVVTVLLMVGLWSFRLVAAVVIPLMTGLIWTAAVATALIGTLNMISIAFAVLFIGLGVDFGIHVALRYREAAENGVPTDRSLQSAVTGVGGALTLCTVAASIAFFSFLPTDYVGLAELGLISGLGMFIALFCSISLLPALISLLPLSPGVPLLTRYSARIDGWLGRATLPVLVLTAAIAVAAANAAVNIRFDFDPLNLKDNDVESVSTLRDLIADDTNSPYEIVILADDLDQAVALAARLEQLDEVKEARTLKDFVPDDQADKVAIIEEIDFTLMPLYEPPQTADAPDPAAQLTALTDFIDRLKRFANRHSLDDPDTVAAARRLADRLEELLASRDDPAAVTQELNRRLLIGLPLQISRLTDAMSAEPFGLDELPRDLRLREVAPSGVARVTAIPQHSMDDPQAIKQFVTAVKDIAPHATGTPALIVGGRTSVLNAFIQAGITSFLLIAIVTFLTLRNPVHVMLVFLPLMLSGLITVACSVVLNQPFNFANMIVLPLLFGLGVAGNIHMVMRARQAGPTMMGTSTPRAVVLSGLTTMGSFGAIALSSHPGTASMGILLTIAISANLFCALVVLPALLRLTGGFRSASQEAG